MEGNGATLPGSSTGGLAGPAVLGVLERFGTSYLDRVDNKIAGTRPPGSTDAPSPRAPAPRPAATAVAKEGPGPRFTFGSMAATVGAALVVGLLVYFVTGKNAAYALIAAVLAAVAVAFFMAKRGG
jgi:hypothetical protein